MNINQPREHFELGDHVSFHHQACVARVPLAHRNLQLDPPEYWIVCGDGKWEHGPLSESPVHRLPFKPSGRNKTIVCWPSEGSGIVIGLVRRGIGHSHAGYESGYEYPEWEPGYFAPEEWHWLYAVKTHLAGTSFILTPLWATWKEE